MRRLLSGMTLLALFAACDRNVEPFVPGEEPREPDLSRIFPEPSSEEGLGAGAAPAATAGMRGNLPPARAEAPDTASGEPITGRIELDPQLSQHAAANAVLFVIARRSEGGGPPLAVRRVPAPRFPYDFEIGPQHAMIQGMPFAGEIQLEARLDADGDALSRAPGDLSGRAPEPLQPGASGVRIVLDTLQ